MRVLHLTPELPYAPGGSGGSTRQFHLLRRLIERGHDVTVVAPVHQTQATGAVTLADAGIRLAAVRRGSSRVKEALRALARRPALVPAMARLPVLAWQVEVFWTTLRRIAARELESNRPDVISVEHDWAALWHHDLPPDIKRVLTLQNLSWAYYEARARAARGAPAVALRLEAARFRRFDARHLNAYDLLVAMSEPDRRAAAQVSRARCVAIPNGADVRTSAPSHQTNRPAPLVLFTGTLSYPPNAEGLHWLLRDVWPSIRARVPHAHLRVIGRDPPQAAVRLAGPGVELAGWVPDVAPHFAEAAVVVVPILSGGGTRLKVLDGLAAARAIVSTSAGVEGLEVRNREHVMLADEPQAFASAVVDLLGDSGRRAQLAAAGRALAESRYDWDVLGDRFEAELTALVSR